jgi:hypothetical protein
MTTPSSRKVCETITTLASARASSSLMTIICINPAGQDAP